MLQTLSASAEIKFMRSEKKKKKKNGAKTARTQRAVQRMTKPTDVVSD